MFVLEIETGNTYEQTKIERYSGEAVSPEDFLEMCYGVVEEGIENPNIKYEEEAPPRFEESGGFAELSRNFTRDGEDLNHILDALEW